MGRGYQNNTRGLIIYFYYFKKHSQRIPGIRIGAYFIWAGVLYLTVLSSSQYVVLISQSYSFLYTIIIHVDVRYGFSLLTGLDGYLPC